MNRSSLGKEKDTRQRKEHWQRIEVTQGQKVLGERWEEPSVDVASGTGKEGLKVTLGHLVLSTIIEALIAKRKHIEEK